MEDRDSHFDSRRVAAPGFGVQRDEATAVLHPFGRGEFKEIARKAVIPKIVLDAMVNKHEPSWSRSSTSGATWIGGGATRQKPKMGGVNRLNSSRSTSESSRVKPKVSCRGRALKMRAEKSRMPRPGAGSPDKVDYRRSSVAVSNHGGGSSRSKEGRQPGLSQRKSIKDDRISVASEPLLVQTHHSTQEDWKTYNSRWPSLKAANNLSCFSDAGSSDVLSDNSLHFSPPPPSITSDESKQVPITTSAVVKDVVEKSQDTKANTWVPIDRRNEGTENDDWYEEGWMHFASTEDTTIVEQGRDEWTPIITEEDDSRIEPTDDNGTIIMEEPEVLPVVEQFKDVSFPVSTQEVDTVNEESPDIEVEISVVEKPHVESDERALTCTVEEAQDAFEGVGEVTPKYSERESSEVEPSHAISIPTATEEIINKPSDAVDILLVTEDGLGEGQFQDAYDPASTTEETVPLTEEVDDVSKQSHEVVVQCESDEDVPVIEGCNDTTTTVELEEGFEMNVHVLSSNVPDSEVEDRVIEQLLSSHAIIPTDLQAASNEGINENTLALPTSTVHDETTSIINEDLPVITRAQDKESDEPVSEGTILVKEETRESVCESVSPIVKEASDSQTLTADVRSNMSNEEEIESTELYEITTPTDERHSLSEKDCQECKMDAEIDECASALEEIHSNECVPPMMEDSEEDTPVMLDESIDPMTKDISQEDSRSIDAEKHVEDGEGISDIRPTNEQIEHPWPSAIIEDTEAPCSCKEMDKEEVSEELLDVRLSDSVKTELQSKGNEEDTILSGSEESLPQDQNVSSNTETIVDSSTHITIEPQTNVAQPVNTLLDNSPSDSNPVHNVGEQECPIAKEVPSDIQIKPEALESMDTCSTSTPAIVCAAVANQEESLGWSLDNQSLCFGNLPSYVTEKELEQMIEPFGSISHCNILRETHDNSTSTVVAYVRMEKKSACNWVISCFHGSPYDGSPLHIQCNYAIAGGAPDDADYMIENFDIL